MRKFAQELALECAFGQQLPQRACLAGEACAAFGAGEFATSACGIAQKLARGGRCYGLGKAFGSVGADEAVGVVLFGQEQEFDAAVSLAKGRAACGALRAALRPAVSPSAPRRCCRCSEEFAWSLVQAVPSVATALPKPSCARATTSI